MSFGAKTAIVALVFLPVFAYAQSNEELRATIGGALLQDPAAAALPQAEFEALLDAMVADAEARGVTVEDISYVPPNPADSFPVAAIEEATAGLSAGEKTAVALGALALVLLALWLVYRWLHEAPASAIPPMNQGMPRQY